MQEKPTDRRLDKTNLHVKRKYPRRRYRRPVGIMYQGQFWLVRGEEIGEGGLLIKSTREIPESAVVLVTLFVPGGEIAIIRCEVRYILSGRTASEYRIGLQFINFSFKHKKKIRDYIAAKSEAEAELDRESA